MTMIEFLCNLFDGKGEPMPAPKHKISEKPKSPEIPVRVEEHRTGSVEQHKKDIAYVDKLKEKLEWLYDCQHPNMIGKLDWKDDIIRLSITHSRDISFTSCDSSLYYSFSIQGVVDNNMICGGTLIHEFKYDVFGREKYEYYKYNVITWYVDDKCKAGVLQYIDEKILNITGFKTKNEKFCERIHEALNDNV